ncbi:uncharacterized protein [Sinocyclocheilus grahami]|uniref:uncharacterized protein n=1 Tax=Sinocyclocheilus grahami TaxID=75366 RepID=UPI0007AD629B|nr:PREDICTED: uncharacterized protein LOC107573643 [Sinocyclocheilus grahami]
MSRFVFLLLIYAVSGAETEGSESVTVMEADSVTLHTNLSELLNDDTILWMFGPKDSLISQIKRKLDLTSFLVTDDVRFSGRLQVDQKTGSLSITNTRIRHSGQYKLSISREKTTTKTFSVAVISVADEADGVQSVSVSVTEGDPVTLCIDAEMHKDALMLWRFGDQGILLARIDTESSEVSLNDADERFRGALQLNQNGSLTIKKSRSEHAGLYELQIRGRESAQRFLLSVNAVPDPGLSSGAVAGVVFGVLVPVLLLVAAALALIYYRHRIAKLKKQMAVAGEEKEETVTEGDSPTLHTGLTEINANDMIEWCYEAEDNRIAQINGGTRSTLAGADGRFRSKLMLDDRTGDLTISNVRTIHSGLYKLNISSSIQTKHKRFILTVSVKSISVKEGASVLLQTAAEIQTDDLILWTLGAQNCLVVKSDSGKTSIGKHFRDRLDLNMTTGSLTLRNIRTTDSGHFKLQIINSEQTTFRRFNVTVTDSTAEGASEETTVVTPLLNGEVTDGGSEPQATSPV